MDSASQLEIVKLTNVCVKRQEVPILVGSKNDLISPQLPISFRKYMM
jgi:hypothetical protein